MDWDNQIFTFYPNATEVTFNNTDSVSVVLDFRSRVYESLKMGIFKPFPRKKSFITQLEPVYARNVFPCLDEPKYRAIMRLKILLTGKKTKAKDYMVLSNMPAKPRPSNSKYWKFERTKTKLPAYLYAFAVLRKNEYVHLHSFNYFHKPINIYISLKLRQHATSFLISSFSKERILTGREFPHDEIDAGVLEFAIQYSITWCEAKFQIDLIWDKLDFVFTEMEVSGMENPGLIFLKVSFICKECVISTIVHQIVHQWTGVRITIDSFDNIWISEGLTGYITSQILQQLQKWNRIPWRSYPLNEWLQYYSSKVALAVIDGRYTAVDGGEGYWSQSYFYAKLGNTIANLDDFMGHTLMQVKHASFCDNSGGNKSH